MSSPASPPSPNREATPAPPNLLAQASFGSSPQRDRLNLLAGIVADIDHTMLKQTTTTSDLKLLCAEALLAKASLGVGPKAVCVNSSDVAYCVEQLAGSGIAVCSVVGFPLGKMLTSAKVDETKAALAAGAREIDMVLNVGALKAGQHQYVQEEMRQIATACHAGQALLKVIIETCNLTEPEKITACRLAEAAGADFVKTSTGTERAGATIADVTLMRQCVSPQVQVKAAGGMKTPEDAVAMRRAGANRFGSSGLLKTILTEIGAKTGDGGADAPGQGSY